MGNRGQRIYPLKVDCLEIYTQERNSLSKREIDEIFERGKQWDFSETLTSGGSLFFPHTYIRDCGDQIAGAVNSCLASGADQILVLGVLHCFYDPKPPERGIYSKESGPARSEYSLDHFQFLFDEALKREGIPRPKLFLRYPFRSKSEPSTLPGIEELTSLVKDSIVVATSDLCHHGKAYGTSPNEIRNFGMEGEAYAKQAISEGFTILQSGNYSDYQRHCNQILSDSPDVASVLHHFMGPFTATISDLKLVDVAKLFQNNPTPSWVAASLIHCSKEF